jgi:hypothetical protein
VIAKSFRVERLRKSTGPMRRRSALSNALDLNPASDNAANISAKSRFMIQALERPCLEGELPDHRHALGRIPNGRLGPVFAQARVGDADRSVIGDLEVRTSAGTP